MHDAYKCYQCGICTGDCPVAWVNESFNPRKIVLKLQENQRVEEVFLCSMCFKCLRCPREVKPVELFSNLRKKGSKLHRIFVDVIRDNGRIVEHKLIMKLMGLESLKMFPIALKMFRSGKISFKVRKDVGEEVRILFEVCK